MVAASRVLAGVDVACPNCGAPHLRHYFHRFDPRASTGSVWVWCGVCRTHAHLPRVAPRGLRENDPFAGLDAEAFAALELDTGTRFLDRLDGLWERAPLDAAGTAP